MKVERSVCFGWSKFQEEKNERCEGESDEEGV